jgi:hypothetical protein
METLKLNRLVVGMAVVPDGVWNLENVTLRDGNGILICSAMVYKSPKEVKKQLDSIVRLSKLKPIPCNK